MHPQCQANQHIVACSKAVLFACLMFVSVFHQITNMLASIGNADRAFSHSPISMVTMMHS